MTGPTDNPDEKYRAGYSCDACEKTIATITTTPDGVLLLCGDCLIDRMEQAAEDSWNESDPGSCDAHEQAH